MFGFLVLPPTVSPRETLGSKKATPCRVTLLYPLALTGKRSTVKRFIPRMLYGEAEGPVGVA